MAKTKQLSKWESEVRRLSISSLKDTDSALFNHYKDALKEMKVELKRYIDTYDELSFSKRLEAERQLQVANKIDSILIDLNKWSESDIRKSIEQEVNFGYYGTWYALEGAENIQLGFAMLPEKYIEELVNKPVSGKRFSTRLYQNRTKLAEQVTQSMLQGATNGHGYSKIAKQIGELTEADYKKALRIARTEGGRVQSTTKQRAYEDAKEMGVDIQKQWMSTLDSKTRHQHQVLDGQVVDIEAEFTSPSGSKAKGPRLFGIAAEDIHCRCTTSTVVNGISPELRRDNETKEIIKYTNYNEWAEAKGLEPKTKEISKYSMFNEEIRSALTGEQLDFYEQKFNSARSDIQSLWKNYQNDVVLKDGNYKKGAFYHPNIGVQMNVIEDLKGNSYTLPGNTFFHEIGHNIDNIASGERFSDVSSVIKLSNNKSLGETVYAEVREHLKNAPGNDRIERTYAFRDALMKDYEKNAAAMRGISDVVGGSTSNQVKLGAGHSTSYWKPSRGSGKKLAEFRAEKLGSEAFAEMFSAEFTNEKEVAMYEKWLPKSYNAFKELVNKIMK